MSYNLITILGPTAVGKTNLGVNLAYKFSGEIISADSRQVYRGMDIGTGKDLTEYIINKTNIKYHLIDIINPKDEFNLFEFIKHFNAAFSKIRKIDKTPIMVGGTGLYLSSVLQKYKLSKVDFNDRDIEQLKKMSTEELALILKKLNFKLHNTTDLLDRERIIKAIAVEKSKAKDDVITSNVNSYNIGIFLSMDKIKEKIKIRLKHRFEKGMIEEVKSLMDSGISYERIKLFGLEYKFIAMYLKNEINYNDMYQKLNSAINGLAKRQMTWFRKMEKEGCAINWIDGNNYTKAQELIKRNYFNE
ncbi:MAG: tRNA (adenosine(37)-N6)-dimethylallyltransferase MiaA [Bacteroidetes bacterium]|nr:tRNA (adenosine(37)-N6)-dimethylallyltransferase MiaA [Bacteroidota bacterium]